MWLTSFMLQELRALQDDAAAHDLEDSSTSLEAFYARFTSDDDASFLKIMEKDKERLRARYWWLVQQVRTISGRV